MRLCDLADGREVRKRERLTACHVQARFDADEGDALRAGGEHALEAYEVDIALERVRRLRVARLGDGDVDPGAARKLDVRARGREVEVRRHQRPRLDQELREQVLGAAPLMGRDQVPVAVGLPHRSFEPEEAARPGVRLVAELHRRALLLRQRRRAAVRQEVDEHVVGAEQEGVVAGLLERGPPRRRRFERDRLDDLDLPRGYGHARIVALELRADIRE